MTKGAAVLTVLTVTLVIAGGVAFGARLLGRDGELQHVAPEQFEAPPDDGAYGVVTAVAHPKAGLELLGWEAIKPRWEVHVTFVPPATCQAPTDTGEVTVETCPSLPATGRMIGAMATSNSPVMWTVAIEITEACYHAVALNDRWPTTYLECRDP
ncbi:MAG: hypothetical protein HRF45_13790 [Fimbriimonadia bacterium]|jgi:hypothetical protein